MRLFIRFGKNDVKCCYYCAHWDGNEYMLLPDGRKKMVHRGIGCIFGTENCPYAKDPEPIPVKEPRFEACKDCPYGRGKACVGWCTRWLLGQIDKVE